VSANVHVSPWVSNFGHVTTKVNVHGQNSLAEVSFFSDYFSVQPIYIMLHSLPTAAVPMLSKMYLVSSNVLYSMRTFKQYLQIVDDNVHTILDSLCTLTFL
jgi:hypothetical protein